MSRILIFSFVLLGLSCGLIAQNDLGVHLIPGYYQAGLTNPAQMPEKRLTFGLPGVYFNYYHSAGAINELLVNQEGEEVLDLTQLINRAEKDNRFQGGVDVPTLSFTYALEKWAFSIHHQVRAHNFTRYPKTLPQLFWEGNAQFIGQTVEFAPEQQSFVYSELGLGITRDFGKFSFGVRAKYLSGMADVSSKGHQASLFTDPDIYQITLNTDYRFNTSAIGADFLIVDSLDQLRLGIGEERLDPSNWFQGNSGYAFDFGVQVRPIKGLTLNLAIENIGQIRWENDVTNYISRGSSQFEGFIIDDILNDSDLSFSEARDSVLELFDFNESQESYTTNLPLSFRISGNFQLNDRWNFGGLYYIEEWKSEIYQAVLLNAYYQVIDRLGVGLSYGVRNERYDNIGLQAQFKYGPIRLMAATDNLPAIFQPFDSDHVNGRIGLQLVF